MPSVVKKTVIPNHPKSRVWGYFGDSEDGQTATSLPCKYTMKIFYSGDFCFVDTVLDSNMITNELHIQHLVHEFHDEWR